MMDRQDGKVVAMNMQELLGQMLQGNMTPSGTDRLAKAVEPQPGGDQSPLGGVFDSWMDKMKSGGGSEMLDNLSATAKDMFTKTKEGVQSGNPLAVGGLAALAGAILGGGKGALRGAAGAGALAVLAKIAFEAMQGNAGISGTDQTRAGTSDHPPLGVRPPQSPAEEATLEHRASLAVRAMIGAAKADGRIDDKEYGRIVEKVKGAGAKGDTARFLEQLMAEPADIAGLAAAASDKEEALQVYAASFLAIEADTPREQDYLQKLAHALRLTQTDMDSVHRSLGVAPSRSTSNEFQV